MSIEYKPTRWEPQLNCSTHPSPDSVHSVVFGLQATNSETGSTAYIDERIVLDPCLTPEELNERSEELMETWAGSRGFYLQLQKALYAKATSTIRNWLRKFSETLYPPQRLPKNLLKTQRLLPNVARVGISTSSCLPSPHQGTG